jgi:hypothetical protein
MLATSFQQPTGAVAQPSAAPVLAFAQVAPRFAKTLRGDESAWQAQGWVDVDGDVRVQVALGRAINQRSLYL